MFLPRPTYLSRASLWLPLCLALLLSAAQCHTPPTPPLPSTPTGPAIRIALLTPTSGELATFGRLLRNGSLMAMEEWNRQGGVLGHHLEWVSYDSGCDFETARQATRQAIDDGLQFIIGPLCSEAAIAAAVEAEAAEILMISPTATHPLVTVDPQGQTRPTVFRASHAYPVLGQAAARFARDSLQVQKAAVFLDTHDPYSRSLVEAFAHQFQQQGGKVVYRAGYSAGDTDFSESLLAIRQAAPEVIYLPASTDIVNRVAVQLNELYTAAESTKPVLLGSDSWESPELDLAATNGSFFTGQVGPTNANPAVQQWTDAYQASYAIEPDTLAVLGYEATLLLLTAIQQAGTLSPPVIAATLEQGTFDGVTGAISFDHEHNPRQPIPILQVKDGQVQVIEGLQPWQQKTL